MSKSIKLKEQYHNTVIGFNNSGAPLGLRNDLHLLYESALRTNQTQILEMFEDPINAKDIEGIKVKDFFQRQSDKKASRSLTPKKNAVKKQSDSK